MRKNLSRFLAVSIMILTLAACESKSDTPESSTAARTAAMEATDTTENMAAMETFSVAETTDAAETFHTPTLADFDDSTPGWAEIPDDFSDQFPVTGYDMETDSGFGPPFFGLCENGVFYLYYDSLSSLFTFGHYVIEDDILTMTSTDGSRIFRFSAEEDGSFIFIQEGSFVPVLIDERFGDPMTDGSRFVPHESE